MARFRKPRPVELVLSNGALRVVTAGGLSTIAKTADLVETTDERLPTMEEKETLAVAHEKGGELATAADLADKAPRDHVHQSFPVDSILMFAKQLDPALALGYGQWLELKSSLPNVFMYQRVS